MNPMINRMDRNAVDIMTLATNFVDMISDCEGLDEITLRNELQNRYPLGVWLLNTEFARMMRRRSTDPQVMHKSSAEGVEWEMSLPGSIYTLDPSNAGTDCCWTMPDFAKCAGSVPLAMLCLKDCDNIFDTMVYERLRINERTDLLGIARSGETLEQVNDRIRKLWFAFYVMHTAILGTMSTSDNITKPFHGLLEVLQNPAVISISGSNIMSAFESVACRLAVLGSDGFVFAVNPLIYRSLEAAIVPDVYGNLPIGWSKDANGRLRYDGIGFLTDKLVPVDMTNMTGDIWVLDESAVGLFLAYELANPKEVRQDFTEQTLENGCGKFCTYLYNYGTVANNNANRIMVISDVPVASACSEIADLAALINPQTLIPAV